MELKLLFIIQFLILGNCYFQNLLIITIIFEYYTKIENNFLNIIFKYTVIQSYCNSYEEIMKQPINNVIFPKLLNSTSEIGGKCNKEMFIIEKYSIY